MKSKCILFLFFIVSFAVRGQTSFGFKGGLNLSTIGGTQAETTQKFGYHFGGFVLVKVNDKFGISPEFVFSRQGTQAQVGDLKLILNYINIPVIFSYYAAEHWALQAGPQLGLLAQSKLKDDDRNSIKFENTSNQMDLSLALGIAADVDNTIVSIRYNLGLTNAFDTDTFYPNNVIQLSVGIKLTN